MALSTASNCRAWTWWATPDSLGPHGLPRVPCHSHDLPPTCPAAPGHQVNGQEDDPAAFHRADGAGEVSRAGNLLAGAALCGEGSRRCPPRPHAPSLPSPGAVGPLTHPCGPAVSLENVLLDVKELGRGMELLRRECGLHENSVLRSFLAASEGKLERLQKDARTAEVRAAERRCLARPLHTRCHARLALHSCLACLALHAPCALMPCFAHSSCTPALLCTLLVHALLCTALVHILLRAALVHALLYTLLMHACSALHAPRARLSLHTPRARRPPGAAGCAARR